MVAFEVMIVANPGSLAVDQQVVTRGKGALAQQVVPLDSLSAFAQPRRLPNRVSGKFAPQQREVDLFRRTRERGRRLPHDLGAKLIVGRLAGNPAAEAVEIHAAVARTRRLLTSDSMRLRTIGGQV